MIPFPDKKYKIIYADPPWSYRDKSLNRGGALRHYNTMSIADIANLPVSDIADDNCVLFLWVTLPKINECWDVISSWGFEYKTCAFVWVKANKRAFLGKAVGDILVFDDFVGMGRWTRSNAELCLLAIKGKPERLSASVRQIVYAPIGGHSEKPSEVCDRILQLMGDIPRIVLFARKPTPGWDVWGDEVTQMDGDVIGL